MDGAAYWLAGMRIESDIPLPELPRLESSPPQYRSQEAKIVHIHRGNVTFELAGGVEIDPDCIANSREFLLRIPGVARYRVSHGEEIVVDAAEGAPPLNVRTYLLGSVFSVLCHQRGLLPLHASAIRYGGGVAAFLGNSGEGKSSLAAHLAKRGHSVVADDLCLVETAGREQAEVIPSAPWLKLWRASLDQLGRGAEGLDQVYSEDDKYRLPLEKPALTGSGDRCEPLGMLIFLEHQSAGEQQHPRLVEVPRLLAITRLMSFTHQAFMVEALGLREENFRRCGKALSGAKAYRLERPWGFEHMEETVTVVEDVLRGH